MEFPLKTSRHLNLFFPFKSSSSDQAALCDVVSARKRYHWVPGLLYLSPIHFLAMSPQSLAKSMSVHSNTVPWQTWDNNGKGVCYGEC
jgi:hypothetical protein